MGKKTPEQNRRDVEKSRHRAWQIEIVDDLNALAGRLSRGAMDRFYQIAPDIPPVVSFRQRLNKLGLDGVKIKTRPGLVGALLDVVLRKQADLAEAPVRSGTDNYRGRVVLPDLSPMSLEATQAGEASERLKEARRAQGLVLDVPETPEQRKTRQGLSQAQRGHKGGVWTGARAFEPWGKRFTNGGIDPHDDDFWDRHAEL
jgi:hypothetical protein